MDKEPERDTGEAGARRYGSGMNPWHKTSEVLGDGNVLSWSFTLLQPWQIPSMSIGSSWTFLTPPWIRI
jgi:hypothetical protein